VGLAEVEHTLLAYVLGALKQEDVLRLATVAHEVFSLEFGLREVLNKNTRADFQGEMENESTHDGLLVLTVYQSLVIKEFPEVKLD
jgi:hypothetical protein